MAECRRWLGKGGLGSILAVALIFCIVTAGEGGGSQDNATPSGGGKEKAGLAGKGRPSDFLPRIGELRVRSEELHRRLAEDFRTDSFEKRYGKSREELDSVREKLNGLKVPETCGFDDVSSLRGRVWKVNEDLLNLTDDVAGRFALLESLQKSWRRTADEWEAFDKRLADDHDARGARNLVAEARSLTSKALEAIEASYDPVATLQARTARLQDRAQEELSELDRLMKDLRREIFRINASFMLSRDYFQELHGSVWLSGFEDLKKLDLFNPFFLKNYGWLLVLQLFMAMGLAVTLRRGKKEMEGEASWRFMVKHPWATSVLGVMALFFPLYRRFPESWRFLFWTVAAICVVRIMNSIFREKWRRRMALVAALPFLLFMLCRIVELPFPLFRLYVALAGMAGAPLFFRLAAGIDRSRKNDVFHFHGLRLGGAIFSLVFLTQVTGFSSFSVHLFEASIKSLLLLAFLKMVVLLAKGGLELALGIHRLRRLTCIQRNRHVIYRQLLLVVKIFVTVVAVVLLLPVWGFYDTPAEAWESLNDLGFSVEGTRWSVHLIFLALLVFFSALIFSRILQTVLWEEVYRRRNIEEGIGISINRLIHYAFLGLGFFALLSLLGFDLRSLAILGGAVGVGVGFGLQNIVNNFVSGLILLVERPVKVGDVVVVDDSWGEIRSLGLRATIVETYDASEIIIPNSDLVTGKVVNWSRVNRSCRLVVPVGVACGSNIEEVIGLLTQIASAHPGVASEPAPVVHFTAFGESSLNFQLKVWVHLNDRLSVQTELMKEIDRRFREEGIEMPFPQRDIRIRSGEASW